MSPGDRFIGVFAAIASPIALIIGLHLYFGEGNFELAVIAFLASLSLDGTVITTYLRRMSE